MKSTIWAAKFVGAFLTGLGIVGIFIHLSSNDGAVAVTGAVLLAAGIISDAITRQN